jgi:hypothetical protein
MIRIDVSDAILDVTISRGRRTGNAVKEDPGDNRILE